MILCPADPELAHLLVLASICSQVTVSFPAPLALVKANNHFPGLWWLQSVLMRTGHITSGPLLGSPAHFPHPASVGMMSAPHLPPREF